jgi:hypothetical protein
MFSGGSRGVELRLAEDLAGQSLGPPSTKLVQKRYRVIEELTKTEHSFCVDMMAD